VHGFAGRCLTTRPLHRWGLMPLQPRADDGIRTRDPHLGKVMRYQLRYIRKPRAIVSLAAMVDNSAPKAAATNPLGLGVWAAQTSTVLVFVLGVVARWCCHPGPVAQWKSVRFTRGRSLVRSQPGPPVQGLYARRSSSATAVLPVAGNIAWESRSGQAGRSGQHRPGRLSVAVRPSPQFSIRKTCFISAECGVS
jgi:hypothetical protein